MSTEKVIVSEHEVRQALDPATHPTPHPEPQLSPAIPWWARAGLWIVALIFPLLCLVALILRIAFRAETPRIQYAWTSFLTTLLMASGMVTLIAGVLVFCLAPVPVIVGAGLADLDQRPSFPVLPSKSSLNSEDVSRLLKPLVIVVSPAATRLWNRGEVPSNYFGAGELLQAGKDGYLFVTAKHVVEPPAGGLGMKLSHVLIATQEGTWGSADLAGTADSLDLALIWLPRHSGSATFVQPITTISDGAPIFVIGHPEGLRYTLTTGIVSGVRDQLIQVSAAVSPGNSGGPVYDDHGDLAGIVSSKFDHYRDANAENLSFAVKPAALLNPGVWHFAKGGREHLQRYIDALQSSQPHR